MASEIFVALPEPFAPGARKLAFVEGLQVLVFNIAGELLAIENSCPHAGASLASGRLEGRVLRCPSHGMRFDLASGCPPGGSEPRVRTFAITAVAGGARLTLPD